MDEAPAYTPTAIRSARKPARATLSRNCARLRGGRTLKQLTVAVSAALVVALVTGSFVEAQNRGLETSAREEKHMNADTASPKTPGHVKDFALGSLTPRGTRRVIYNSDPSNTTCHLSEPEAQPDELRQIVRNYAREGNIDTLVQEVWHQAWTIFWRTDNCPYDTRPQHQRLVPMMDAGVMPVEVYIDEAHKQNMEFIAGFRMNDRHGHNAEFFEELSEEHPEWILKGFRPSSARTTDPRSYEIGCALDYSQDGVRDWLFSIMEEVANRFDIDGMEFNYTRMPQCFPEDKAEQSHAIMTAFVRRVRAMLDDAGRKKGRKLLLGVRMTQHLEGCRKLGLDIPTWIREKLVDYIAPGDIGFTDFNAKYEEFVRVAREYDCYVYPQVQVMLGYTYRPRLQSPDEYRAALLNFYGAGADGFSTQNYFEALHTLRVLRDPTMVAAGDRHYIFYPLWGPGRGGPGGYEPERIVLNRRKPGARGEFRFRMCENLPADSRISGEEVVSGAMVIFRPGIVPGDELAIDINGKTIAAENITVDWPDEKGRPPVCRFALSTPPAAYGDNYLGMKLVERAPGAGGDIVLDEVEVLVIAAK